MINKAIAVTRFFIRNIDHRYRVPSVLLGYFVRYLIFFCISYQVFVFFLFDFRTHLVLLSSNNILLQAVKPNNIDHRYRVPSVLLGYFVRYLIFFCISYQVFVFFLFDFRTHLVLLSSNNILLQAVKPKSLH